VTVTNGTAKPVAVLTGTKSPGLHRVVWGLRPDGEKDKLAEPGEYTLTLKAGDVTLTKKGRVEAAEKGTRRGEHRPAARAPGRPPRGGTRPHEIPIPGAGDPGRRAGGRPVLAQRLAAGEGAGPPGPRREGPEAGGLAPQGRGRAGQDAGRGRAVALRGG